MEWLLRWTAALERRPEIRRQLNVVANSAAFVRAGRLHVPEGGGLHNHAPAGEISVRYTAVVQRAMHAARRPIAYTDLSRMLLEQSPSATAARVEELLTTLWTQEFLLTDLRPPLTTGDPASHILCRLASIREAEAAREELRAIVESVKRWDATRPSDGGESYGCLAARAAAAVDSKVTAPLQVDSNLPLGGAQITTAVAGEAARAAELLIRLTPLPQGGPQLASYRAAFEARYGAGRHVALLELLDPELGLGPPERHHAAGDAIPDAESQHHIRRERILLDLAINAMRERRSSVELDEDLVSSLGTWNSAAGNAPLTLDINAFVAARSTAALDSGDFRLIVGPNLGAQHAGQMLGRFADFLGPPAVAALEQVAGIEARERAGVHAELVYLPATLRGANVTIRPPIHSHEITFLVTPGVPADRVIRFDEILVGIERNRFILRWSVGSVPIRVHASHMLNARGAPDVCRFLADVCDDGVAQLSAFSWGPAERLPFRPRVESGRIVLRPAEWNISESTRAEWLQAQPAPTLFEKVERWREDWRVPRYVHIGFTDNRLLLDLRCAAHLEELRNELRRLRPEESFTIQEALPRPDEHWLRGPEGHYVTELVIPLGLRTDAVSGTAAANLAIRRDDLATHASINAASPAGTRLMAPGSEWLFAKLYCPRSAADDFIALEMRPFAEEILSAHLADEWFFVRYSDAEGFHVRLRLRGAPGQLVGEALPALCAWANRMMAEGVCTRFAFDTYDREIERYGGEAGLVVAESIFSADSRAAASILNLVHRRIVQIDRTTLAAVSIDDLLASLGLDEVARLHWYGRQADARHDAGPEYRMRKVQLRTLLSDPQHLVAEVGGEALLGVFAERRAALRPQAARLRELAGSGDLAQSTAAMLGSFVHLHCNRLCASDRAGEARVLGLLLRTREGLARTNGLDTQREK